MSGLAGQAIGGVEQLTAIGQDRAVDANSRGCMEPFIGYASNGSSYDPQPVDFNATDDTVTAASDGSTRYTPIYTDNELTWSGGVPADGILFDTARGDSFLDFVITPSNGAVATPTEVTFDSDVPVNVTFILKQGATVLKHCFDTYRIDVLFELTGPFGGASIPGILFGTQNQVSGWFGVESVGHGGLGGGTVLPLRFTNNSQTAAGTAGATIGAGIPCENVIELTGNDFYVSAVNDAILGLDITDALTYVAGSLELPREFSTIGAAFYGGHVKLTGLKYEVSYPNATYALIGDSLTQGRFATNQPSSYGQLFRDANPDNTLVCGAPGATIEAWDASAIETVARLQPKYAVVLLGSNNVMVDTAAVMKAKYDVMIASVEASGMIPIVVSVSPRTNVVVPEFNALLQASYPKYIDIYTALVGTGTELAPAYDSGDGVHWNDAGHAQVASVVLAAISANGWT